MKHAWVIVFLLSVYIACADVIAQWNFNSVLADASTSTGTNVPSVGNGTASLIGGVSAAFSSGAGSADPAANTDDSAWNTQDYPIQNASNKMAGVQFAVSTIGYSNIVVRWDHRGTKTASKYYRLQYSWDGYFFIDYNTPVNVQVDSMFFAQTNNLGAVTTINNNGAFTFRIVSEFESTATGSGFNGYVTPYGTNTYDPNGGTVRFDYVTVFGTPIPGGNTPPTILSSIGTQSIHVNQSTGPLGFTVLDAEDPATNLTVNATSSNPTVIPSYGFAFGGSGSSRTVNVTAANQVGSSTITLWVIDTGGKSNSASFLVNVLPANTAPVISAIPVTNCLINSAVMGIPLTVGDAETPAASLTVSASSSNPGLLPNANIVFGGSGSNRTVSITPVQGQIGVAPITVTVSDGTNTASSLFALMVSPSPNVLFLDSFAYTNGSAVTNSGFLWQNRSGTDGQCQVTNGQLQVSGGLTEDIIGRLIGGPYDKGNGTVLYAAFKVKFLTLPRSTPDYFAHFANGSTLRARIHAAVPTNAAPGVFRLQIANATNAVEWPANLMTNVTYTVVTRYNLDTPASMLWVNPTAETDPGVAATDTQSPQAIASYGFREDSGVEATVLVDDLKVGLSFAAVTGTNYLAPIALACQRSGNSLVLSWANSAFSLQAAPFANGPFTNVLAAVSPFTNAVSGVAKYFRLKAN
jgi:hypothetical protein